MRKRYRSVLESSECKQLVGLLLIRQEQLMILWEPTERRETIFKQHCFLLYFEIGHWNYPIGKETQFQCPSELILSNKCQKHLKATPKLTHLGKGVQNSLPT